MSAHITRSRLRTIEPGSRGDHPPLSFAQRSLWLLDQLHPVSPAYNVPLAVELTGPLDIQALAAALRELVRRHEILRTTVGVADGEPYQHVTPADQPALPVIDLTDLPHSDADRRADELVDEWAHEPFDLRTGPMLRVRLIRTRPDQHLLVVVMHHFVCDGPSVHLLFDELARHYTGDAGPERPTVQFADFADWQRRRAAGPADLAWWRDYLTGAPRTLDLPSDHARPAHRSTRGATHVFNLPGALMRDAFALASQRRVTPFMLMFAAYAALLGRLAGTRDLLVATPVSGRSLPELEPLIGIFVNTLPIRVDLTGDPDFHELLDRVRQSTLAAVAHQDVPFETLVDELRTDRNPGHNPLVQTLFTFEPTPLAEPRLAGLTARLLTLRARSAKFDLDFMVVRTADDSGDFEVWANYSTDLFTEETITRLARRFERVLTAAVTRPGHPLRLLPVLDATEHALVTTGWAAGGPAHPTDVPVPELVARIAATTPHAPAVALGDTVLSYAELIDRADQLARRLRDDGVRPGSIVGILLPRCPDLVVAALGVLRAGAAYLPMDPVHPIGHRRRTLAASGARHVVTTTEGDHQLAGIDVETVLIDQPDPEATDNAISTVSAAADQLAYVIFTSGSTGEPKGVGITHRGLVNHAQALVARYGLGAADRVLQFANIGFDVAAEEIFPTLVAGGCVVLCTDPPAPEALGAVLDRERISVANLPASYWQQWVATLDLPTTTPARTLRLLVVGSESVDVPTATAWCRHTNVPLLNAYGLTETTITSTIYEMDGPLAGAVVPVGRPVDGVRAYVLDDELEPVPPGAPGDLYLAGSGLARGYLGQPALTAERFVPCPFGAEPGARMHRTGDRARWRADGVLELLGRADAQLKVRGYRIEPAEVEAALRAHPAVAQAVVAARPGRDGQRRLVGYVVPHRGGSTPADLREHMASRLPAHLVPSVFVALERLPLSASGKVDPTALPEPPAAVVLAGVAARSGLERRLTEIWQEALDLSGIGVTDNFFDLGGTSFTLAAVHHRLRDLVDPLPPLVTLYEHPTIASLAARLSGTAPDRLPPGPPAPRTPAVRARLRQQRLAHR
jgi:amino acid adenylation domain-containing protein